LLPIETSFEGHPTAQVLKQLCSQQQVHPEDFISLFINSPGAMIDFLEHIVNHRFLNIYLDIFYLVGIQPEY
jgi:hypothetical protein